MNKPEIIRERIITLRSVFDKSGNKYYLQPCKDKNGQYPPCIKRVDSNGNMIMSEAEKGLYSEGKAAFFPVDHIFVISSGKTYDLDDMYQKAEWEAIQNSPIIAKSRDAKDNQGNLVIDGTKTVSTNKIGRNGIAELYIDRPEVETAKRVQKRQLIHKAESLIFDDPEGASGNLKMAKLLGKDMTNQSANDVQEFLLRIAKEDPQRIIKIYTGGDVKYRLLFIDAKKKKVIYIKNKVYLYGDDVVLGATDEAVINWMTDIRNKRVLDLIIKDTYPEYYQKEQTNEETSNK